MANFSFKSHVFYIKKKKHLYYFCLAFVMVIHHGQNLSVFEVLNIIVLFDTHIYYFTFVVVVFYVVAFLFMVIVYLKFV